MGDTCVCVLMKFENGEKSARGEIACDKATRIDNLYRPYGLQIHIGTRVINPYRHTNCQSVLTTRIVNPYR